VIGLGLVVSLVTEVLMAVSNGRFQHRSQVDPAAGAAPALAIV